MPAERYLFAFRFTFVKVHCVVRSLEYRGEITFAAVFCGSASDDNAALCGIFRVFLRYLTDELAEVLIVVTLCDDDEFIAADIDFSRYFSIFVISARNANEF